jgi:glycosyltransferase involved in cell wall biosynthesis
MGTSVRIVVTGPAPVRELADDLVVDAADLPPGMPGTPVIALARQLAAMGHETTLVTGSKGVTREDVRERGRLRVRIGPYRSQHVGRDAFRSERAYIRQAIADENADVVHAHWTYEFAAGALESGTPTLVTVRDWAPAILRYHPDPYRVVRLGMQLRVLRSSTHTTVTSPYLQRRVRWVARRPPVLIPNAIADDVLDRAPPFRPLGSPPRLVAVNNGWSRRKNVQVLLRALPSIRKEVAGTELELVGAGYGPNEAAECWAREQRLDAGVVFRGQVPADGVVAALRRADLFVHPSREESFGLVLVEAMAQGVAVVGGVRSGAVPWVLKNGAAGRLVDVEDPRDLAGAVVSLLRDHPTRIALAHSGHEHASTLTTSAVTRQYLRCYSEIAT